MKFSTTAFLLAFVPGVASRVNGGEPTTDLVVPSNMRVKDVVDHRGLQRVLDSIYTFDDRKEFEHYVGPLSWCADFSGYDEDAIFSENTVDIDSIAGDTVFSLFQPESTFPDDPESVSNRVRAEPEDAFIVTRNYPGETPAMTVNLDLVNDAFAWGASFRDFLCGGELLDLELDLVFSSGTIALEVNAPTCGDGVDFFFGFSLPDDDVTSVDFKSRNAGSVERTVLDDVCAAEYCYQEEIHCDFDFLIPDYFDNYYLSYHCGVTASTTATSINVFDSSDASRKKYPWADPDLAAPNRKCSPKGRGRGVGGRPDANYPNCDPLGNLLIIQDPDRDFPNDLAAGGCMDFHFNKPVDFHDFGLIDVEEGSNTTFTHVLGYEYPTIFSPTGEDGVGDNGYWEASMTEAEALYDLKSVTKMQVCFEGSGGLAFMKYTGCAPHYYVPVPV